MCSERWRVHNNLAQRPRLYPASLLPQTLTLIKVPGLGDISEEWLHIALEKPSSWCKLSIR